MKKFESKISDIRFEEFFSSEESKTVHEIEADEEEEEKKSFEKVQAIPSD